MNRAFTLIELLIVVAIIAILAAIAVPNFLEAQIRAKASRMKADLRTLSTGLETYRLDGNAYPMCNSFSLPGARPEQGETLNTTVNMKARILERLSTPVSYLSNPFLNDVFKPTHRRSSFTPGSPQGTATAVSNGPNRELEQLVKYAAINATRFANHDEDGQTRVEKARSYLLHAAGPNRNYANSGDLVRSTSRELAISQVYDPTNGTSSYGYIWRLGGEAPANAAYATVFFNTVATATSR